MKKNEITIFIQSLRGGGAERVCVTIANKMVLKSCIVSIVVLNLRDAVFATELDKRIKLINLHAHHARTSFFKIAEILRKNDINNILVFNHEIAVVLVLLRYLLKKRFKIVSRNISTLSKRRFYEKSFWHRNVKEIFIRRLYRFVDHFIAQSKNMQDDLINYYNINKNRISIIYNPLRPEIELEMVKNYNQPVKPKYEIVFIGRLESSKGIPYLLDAFKLVLKKKPDLKLRIVGTGKLFNELTEYTKKLKIENAVIFEGFKSNVIPYYKQARLTVLSSLYEGFPNVLVESIALGTPIIAFDCKSGPREIIQEGVNGFIANYKDIQHLAQLIIKGLDYYWDKKKVQETAYHYRSDSITQEYIEVFNKDL